ncbi:caspase family protein [Sphingomonas lycopersici]|uniref:Caspase family protein n=1 Tax=Sphingomonas lycopersici TaxID=2951807 RepID=A0AA42CS56_9SPHN|nr:caspase family protein [Sphingomonas lycopersici]MCW6536882.1 caspase family protein [Sphingomonas lycopersici]
MSGRALIAIGCDAYDHIGPLSGAESDARDIFSTLMRPEVGDYDVERSRLLQSPTLQEVRNALATVLFDGGPLDTLALSFAGHGAVGAGSFYMALRDTKGQALSATALSLADLLRMVAEAAPKQTYLFIDACQSGGLISDLNVILKSEVMGELGTPGVTLVATAAANQSAYEVGGHGIGTTALLDCVRGDVFLQDTTPALDLVEIGRAVSERVAAAGGQTPVVWGLNLYGPSSFCRNPHAGSGDAPLRSVLVGWPDSATSAAIREGLPQLWEPYVDVATDWEPRKFLARLEPLLARLGEDAETAIGLVARIEESFSNRARGSRDRFRELEVRSACAVALLPRSGQPAVDQWLAKSCSGLAGMVEAAVGDVVAAIAGYEFALINGGLGELYRLPLRLSKLLGWAAFAVHARRIAGEDGSSAAKRLDDLYSRIFATYSLSLVSMSDCQAPDVLIALTASSHAGHMDHGERLLSHMFSSAVLCDGWVARSDLDPSKQLSYLIARTGSGTEPNLELVAQPTELVLALLRASRLFDLSEHFDQSLAQLDHLALNAYLPETYLTFGEEHIASGVNSVFQIGHDVWSVAELEAAWPDFPVPSGAGQAMTAILSSLLFPDRVPWFLLPVPQLIER